jgi:hypothetical protein
LSAVVIKVETTADNWEYVKEAVHWQDVTKTVRDATKVVMTAMKPLRLSKKVQNLKADADNCFRLVETKKMQLQEMRLAVTAKIQEIAEAQAKGEVKMEEYNSLIPDEETELRLWDGVTEAEKKLDELLEEVGCETTKHVEQEMTRLESEVETRIYHPLATKVNAQWQNALPKLDLFADGGAESTFAVAFKMDAKGLVIKPVAPTRGNNAIVGSDLAAITPMTEEEVIDCISAKGKSKKGKAASKSPPVETPSNGGSPATAVWSGTRKTDFESDSE